MKYDFKNLAIKCDTWEQMESIAKLASDQGIGIGVMNRDYFPLMPYFSVEFGGITYAHHSSVDEMETEISYSDFISNNNTKK